MLDKSLYTTVLCQTFSPCGKYLVAGNNYSQIAVFNLDIIHNPVIGLLSSEYNKPKYLHTLEDSRQIYSLATTKNFLIVGTDKEILGWDWKNVVSEKISKPSWAIKVATGDFPHEQYDVNSMWLSDDEEKLYAGCGDHMLYGYDLENGKKLSTYQGHTDYLHCIHGKENQIVSAGEDGCVFIWDTRTGRSCNIVEPHKNTKLSRPDIGKWIGAAALGGDWFVCGGGPRAALYHLRSLDATTIFDIPNRGIHVASFNDDCVVLGGVTKHLYQMSYAGETKVELPVTATTTYSVLMRTSPNKILSIAGSSPYIDLCTSFMYRDQVLNFR